MDTNTHLVIEVAQGAKYQLAALHSKISIVTPSWLEECRRQGTRVDEGLFPVTDNRSKTLPLSIQPSHCHIFDILLKETNLKQSLFEYHLFYLIGFEDAPEVKKRMGRVIRRGGGTIHWDLSDDVTILVIYDTCHDALRYVVDGTPMIYARNVSRQSAYMIPFFPSGFDAEKPPWSSRHSTQTFPQWFLPVGLWTRVAKRNWCLRPSTLHCDT